MKEGMVEGTSAACPWECIKNRLIGAAVVVGK